jgi:hypothetical protein
MKLAAVALLLTVLEAHSLANSACEGDAGWSPGPSTVLPPHAHLVYRNSRGWPGQPTLVATIDGKPVAVKQRVVTSAPWKLTLVEIDSDRTGKLDIAWQRGKSRDDAATFTIKSKVDYPKPQAPSTSRYHHKLPHSTVREVFDGLAVRVDVPAARAHVKLRRDARAAWVELDVPVVDNVLQVGELGCARNFEPELLEHGVDLELDLELPDGSHPHVDPWHVVLPKLAKPTGTNPWDSE